MMATTEISRVHERLDEILSEVSSVKQIVAKCEYCRQQVEAHESALNGNGGDGIKVRVGHLEHEVFMVGSPRLRGQGGDRISVKGMVTLLGALGTLVAAIAAGIGAAMAKMMP